MPSRAETDQSQGWQYVAIELEENLLLQYLAPYGVVSRKRRRHDRNDWSESEVKLGED